MPGNKHHTSAPARNRARLFHRLTSGPKAKPREQVRIVVESPHGRAAEMFAEAAIRYSMDHKEK